MIESISGIYFFKDNYPKTEYSEAAFFGDANTMQNLLLSVFHCWIMQVWLNAKNYKKAQW
jgi:hypothetical protein